MLALLNASFGSPPSEDLTGVHMRSFACPVGSANRTGAVPKAHIISKSKKGSDHPRNGITLSRTAHWAFDEGMFTISDQFEVVVHAKAKQASVNKFPILDMNGVQINLPEDEKYYLHPEALEWHKKEVFNKFSL